MSIRVHRLSCLSTRIEALHTLGLLLIDALLASEALAVALDIFERRSELEGHGWSTWNWVGVEWALLLSCALFDTVLSVGEGYVSGR